MPSRPRWSVILLAWAILATIATLQAAAGYALRGALEREWMWALLQFPRWMTWAVVTPFVFWMERRLPVTRELLARRVGTHLVVALLIAAAIELAWLAPMLMIQERVSPGEAAGIPLSTMISASVFSRLLGGAITYAAVLGVAMTLRYQARLKEREVQASQLEAELAQAQLHALRMQVHPHFLFNTLHAVTVLIREDPPRAIRMVTRLGDLLRFTLARTQASEGSVRREVEILRQYLEIERIRFEDRLDVRFRVSSEALDAALPDLLLQPLVENAIKHGIAGSAARGWVEVRAERNGPWLELEVNDSGKGPGTEAPADGIGLATTRARLERRYGDRATFSLTSLPDGGCSARVRVPYELASDVQSGALEVTEAPEASAGA